MNRQEILTKLAKAYVTKQNTAQLLKANGFGDLATVRKRQALKDQAETIKELALYSFNFSTEEWINAVVKERESIEMI